MPGEEITYDYFVRARRWAAALLLVAGVVAIAGSLLEWVTIVARPQLQEGIDFGEGEQGLEEPAVTEPFTGIEARDGWYVASAGAVLVVAALLLLGRGRSRYAWLGFAASVVVGAIAFADFRGVSELSSSISQRMQIVGRARPAIGLTLVAAAGFVGLLGSVAGIAATPHRD